MIDEPEYEDEHEVESELVMPFVIVKSVGGPFDDAAFVIGWECGELDTRLKMGSTFGLGVLEKTLHVSALPQIDLIAMRYGYKIELGDRDDSEEWVNVKFKMMGLE